MRLRRPSVRTATERTPTPDPRHNRMRGDTASTPVPEKPRLTLRQRALAALARRDHSRAELARKLGRGAEDSAALEALLDEFEANGWLSDERFASSAARQRKG